MTLHEDVFQHRCSRRSILLDPHPASSTSPAPISNQFMFPPKLSSLMVQVVSSLAISPSLLSSLPTLRWHRAEGRGNESPVDSWNGWQKVLPPEITRPPQLCRDGEHQFTVIRPPLHPARKASASNSPGSLPMTRAVRNATLIFAEY